MVNQKVKSPYKSRAIASVIWMTMSLIGVLLFLPPVIYSAVTQRSQHSNRELSIYFIIGGIFALAVGMLMVDVAVNVRKAAIAELQLSKNPPPVPPKRRS